MLVYKISYNSLIIFTLIQICLIITVIEVTENINNTKLLSQEILNGQIYKFAKSQRTSETMNNMQVKICYQTQEDSQETQIMLSNEHCTYTVQAYDNLRASMSSLSSQLSQGNSSSAWMKVQKSTDALAYATSYCEQFSVLLKRMLLQISRNKQGNLSSNYIHI